MQVVGLKELLYNRFSFKVRETIRYYSFTKLVSDDDHVRASLGLRQSSNEIHRYFGPDPVRNRQRLQKTVA